MAIVGVGIDAIELSRIAQLIQKESKVIERILTEKELAVFQTLSFKRKVEYLSGRFAAKEAYAKARGTGIGGSLSFQEITILNDEQGKPLLYCEDEYSKHVSISHTNKDAYAVVILEQPL